MREIFYELRARSLSLFGFRKPGRVGQITPSQARRIVPPQGDPMTLDWVTDLPPAVARMLARHDGQLRLPVLREPSVETARCLARHRGHLYLDGCKTLEPAVAEALAIHGFESMRASAAECLSARASDEGFPEWDNADLNSAELMADIAARIDQFKGIQALTLSLAGLRKLTPGVARALGSHKGTLVLDGLTSISPELAEALVEVKGRIHLYGVRSISSEVAAILFSRLDVSLFPGWW